jgi:hypothetical protein
MFRVNDLAPVGDPGEVPRREDSLRGSMAGAPVPAGVSPSPLGRSRVNRPPRWKSVGGSLRAVTATIASRVTLRSCLWFPWIILLRGGPPSGASSAFPPEGGGRFGVLPAWPFLPSAAAPRRRRR